MFSLKHLRLREQRRQSLQKFAQKAPQPPALKPPSTARTAGRSDRAEHRFRRQPFILLLVGASSISLVSAESGENSLIPLRLLFPPNPLRWASAGALLSSDNRLIYPKYAEGVRPIWRGKVLFRSVSNHTPTNAATLVLLGLSGYTHSTSPTGSHTAAHRAKQGRFERGWYHYPRSVLRGSETLRGRVSERHTLPFCAREECVGKKQRAFWTSTHALCVDVQRRRGPVGTRSPAAGSCAVLVSFTVCHRCIQEQREKFAVGVAWFLLAA